ncbi:hypothetical protein LINGRAHAP2_LOCUS22932, partial [Linum grandiflorum]
KGFSGLGLALERGSNTVGVCRRRIVFQILTHLIRIATWLRTQTIKQEGARRKPLPK